jgi:hypothetical protein
MWRFLLNSSRLFKDFRNIEYDMPCNASYARLFLEGFSYAWQIDMQPICTSIVAKFYSWKMWVLVLVWVEVTPLAFWLDPAAVVEVLLVGCKTLTSRMSPRVGFSEPSTMVERV